MANFDSLLRCNNIRSLQKHVNELNNNTAGFVNKPKIVAISETNLQKGKFTEI